MALPSDIPEGIADRAAILMDKHRNVRDDLEYTARIIMAVESHVPGLTAQQARLLKFYREFQAEHGHTPSYQEAADALGVGKTKIHDVLHQLVDRGLVSIASNRARAVTILARA